VSGTRRALALTTLLLGCGHPHRERSRGDHTVAAASPRDGGASVASSPAPSQAGIVIIDAADPTSSCVFGYRGPVLDLGERALSARFGSRLDPPPVDWIEREGSTWVAARGRSLYVDFFVVPSADVTADGPADAAPFVQARVRGGSARTIAFSLNGRAIGSATLARGETRVIALKAPTALPAPGENELSIRFSTPAKGSTEASAELQWVHFGVGEPDPEYAAPTRADTRVSRSFAGQPSRALLLRGPGFVRCEGWIPSGSVVETRASLEGVGSADAEVRFVRDRAPPTVIGTLHLEAAGANDERVRSWPVGESSEPGTLGAVEISIVRASPRARVVLGDPRVVLRHPEEPRTPVKTTPAKNVVLIVASQLAARSLVPYGGPLATPEIVSLARKGVVFAPGRATTGIANGTVGSMLTGLTARDLGMTDADSRLPRTVTTLADATRQAGISSAMFTANPLTFAAFGFDRGWSHFETHGPTEEGPATHVFDAANAWIGQHAAAPFFILIHSRGGHPPWDVSLERVKGLPPENYTGGLDARHAGELLGRSFRTPGAYRFEDSDRARAWALYGAALESADAGVGSVVTTLKTAGLLDDTTIIFTSDVGVNDAARVPFAESDSLDEAALATPVIIRWAHDTGRSDPAAFTPSSEDIANTVIGAFGLPAPVAFRGVNLRTRTDDATVAMGRSMLAVDRDRFALRWGAFVLGGTHDRETKLCDLSLEPACVTDVRESYPLAARLLHQALFDALVHTKPPAAREPASIDPATLAALRAWGR